MAGRSRGTIPRTPPRPRHSRWGRDRPSFETLRGIPSDLVCGIAGCFDGRKWCTAHEQIIFHGSHEAKRIRDGRMTWKSGSHPCQSADRRTGPPSRRDGSRSVNPGFTSRLHGLGRDRQGWQHLPDMPAEMKRPDPVRYRYARVTGNRHACRASSQGVQACRWTPCPTTLTQSPNVFQRDGSYS